MCDQEAEPAGWRTIQHQVAGPLFRLQEMQWSCFGSSPQTATAEGGTCPENSVGNCVSWLFYRSPFELLTRVSKKNFPFEQGSKTNGIKWVFQTFSWPHRFFILESPFHGKLVLVYLFYTWFHAWLGVSQPQTVARGLDLMISYETRFQSGERAFLSMQMELPLSATVISSSWTMVGDQVGIG